jgi:hypothetical protein
MAYSMHHYNANHKYQCSFHSFLVKSHIPNSSLPASTGKGTNAETSPHIIQSLLSLSFPHGHGNGMDVDVDVANDNGDDNDMDGDNAHNANDDDNDTHGYKIRHKLTPSDKQEIMQESQEEMGYMLSLSQSTNAFSSRCQVLYDALSKKLNGGDKDNHKAIASDADGNGPEKLQEMDQQLRSVKELVLELQVQMKELGKARDVANERERRVRRGLYRIAAGRIDVGEVLKVS